MPTTGGAASTRDDSVVVVGGGPCGAIAAERLLRAGLSVIMLDSGVRAPRGLIVKAAGRTVFRWVEARQLALNRHAGATDPSTVWYSSLSLGGLSNYWTGAVPRFAPEDFTEGAHLDERFAWPVEYDDLAPYYDEVERMLGITAGDSIAGVPPGVSSFQWAAPQPWRDLMAAAASRGHGMGVLPVAKGSPWMFARRGNEFDSFHCIVMPALRTGRLELRRGAHALRVVHHHGVATGVEYADAGAGAIRTVKGQALVLAAGALDTTELLMRSPAPDHPHGLGSTHGVLGRYLHDHPREWYPLRLDRPLPALVHPLYLAREDHRTSAPLLGVSSTLGLTSFRDRVKTFHGGQVTTIGVQAFGTVIPSPDHGLALVGNDDGSSTTSRLHIDLHYDDVTVANIERGRDHLREALAAAGLGTVAGPFHELSPGSSVHYGGSARMHRDERYGVVDAWNRVHGVPNVLVCDASCFTTGPEKNPTLTAMAIAARAADQLARDLGGKPVASAAW